MKVLQLSEFQSTTLRADYFAGLSTLEYFSLESDTFENLSGSLAASMPNLKEISVTSQYLKHLGPNLLTDLSALNKFLFDGDCIGEENFEAGTHEEVLSQAPQLSVRCPPLSEPTTTTTQPTTASTCACDGKIASLETRIQQLKDHEAAEKKKLNLEIKQLKDHEDVENKKLLSQIQHSKDHENAAIEKLSTET